MQQSLYRSLLLAKINVLQDSSDENIKAFDLAYKAYQRSQKSLSFWPSNSKNAFVLHLKHFEEMYAMIEESGIEAKRLTVYEFFNRIDFLRKKAEQQVKSFKK